MGCHLWSCYYDFIQKVAALWTHARVIARYVFCKGEWGFLNGVDLVKAGQMKCMCCNIVKKCINETKWGFSIQMVIAIPKMGLQ